MDKETELNMLQKPFADFMFMQQPEVAVNGQEGEIAAKLNQIAEIKPQEEALSRDVDRAVT